MLSYRAWCGMTALLVGYTLYNSDDNEKEVKQHQRVQNWQLQQHQQQSGDKDKFSKTQFGEFSDEDLDKQISEIKEMRSQRK